MLWVIGILTVVLLLDSLFLILLVLVQLPKKEAGIGQAFGGSATDALFGAGSGNALTKMTKYAAGIFFVLTLGIYILFNNHARHRSSRFATTIQQAGKDVERPLPPAAGAPGTPPTGTPANKPAEPTNAPKAGAVVPNTTNPATRGLLTVPQSPPSSGTPATPSSGNPANPPAK